MRKILLFILLLAVNALGEGFLTGRVLDLESGRPLPMVNIMIKGTYKGGVSDPEGKYFISGIKEGEYTIEARMIGYKLQIATGITIVPNDTTRLNFELEETALALGQEIVVVGEKPLINHDVTSSEFRVTSKEIENKIVENVSEIVMDQSGIVYDENELHIRGGRGDENLFVVDGLSIKDPLSGSGYNLNLSAEAIEEINIITGGFNAEYGQAMSGVIDVKTKEGGEKLEGSVSLKTDQLNALGFSSAHTDIYSFNLSGPEPLNLLSEKLFNVSLPGDLTFFLNCYSFLSDTYLPHASELIPYKKAHEKFAQKQENDWAGLLKITWKPTATKKLSFNFSWSLKANQGYFMEGYRFPNKYTKQAYGNNDPKRSMLDYYNTITLESYQTSAQWTHTLGQQTFYEFTMGRFFTELISSVRGLDWGDYVGAVYRDQYPIRYYEQRDGDIAIDFGDEYYDTGYASNWHRHYTDIFTTGLKFTHHFSEKNQFKTGWENSYLELKLLEINYPWAGQTGLGVSHDLYQVFTDYGSFFIQDEIKFSGMNVNVGIRYDYWLPGDIVEDALERARGTTNPITYFEEDYEKDTKEVFGKKIKGHFSPRLGISHPITEHDMLFLSYGHFSQLPKFQYVYARLASTSESTFQLYGNPNLNPQTTVAYELGLKHGFNNNSALTVTAFYKDIFDYPTSKNVSKEGRPGTFLMYFNEDYARSRGVEVKFQLRNWKRWSTILNFTYSVVTGKSSDPFDAYRTAMNIIESRHLKEFHTRWDKPIVFNAQLTYYVGQRDRLKIGPVDFPKNWGISLRYSYESGRRYTPITLTYQELNDGTQKVVGTRSKDPYSKIGPYVNNVDFKVYKRFKISRYRFEWFWEIKNIFNHQNYRYFSKLTGEPYETDEPYWNLYQNPELIYGNPYNVKEPRNVRMGIKANF